MAITKLHATPVIPNQLPKTIIPIVRRTNEIPVPIITILLLSLPKNCASRINAILNKKFKLDDLLDLLKRNGFRCSIFRHVDTSRLSNRIAGNIYATKV